MIPKWLALTAVCAVAFFAPSCAHDRQLVGITIRPTGATFVTPAPGPQVVFTALGSYVPKPDLLCTISDRKHDHTHRNAKCRIDFHRMDKLHIDIGEYMRSCIERRYKCNSDI